jgi:hypothetical protein
VSALHQIQPPCNQEARRTTPAAKTSKIATEAESECHAGIRGVALILLRRGDELPGRKLRLELKAIPTRELAELIRTFAAT